MSESRLTDSILQQIKAVAYNTRYRPATRILFLEAISALVKDLLPIVKCEYHSAIGDSLSRSQYEHLNGELTNGRSE